MRGKILGVGLILCLCGILPILGSASTSTSAQWVVTRDDLQIFNYYQENDWIRVVVTPPHTYAMTSNRSWYMLDNDWITWNAETCFPFFIDPTVLQNPATATNYTYEINIVNEQKINVLGADRDVIIVRMEKILQDNSMQVYHYITFDSITGVMIKWLVQDQNTLNTDTTEIDLTSTTSWVASTGWVWWQWTLLFGGIGSGGILAGILFFKLRARKGMSV